uniref:glutathione S-transferase family protein n=1 Tax=uncultured Sphingomonas sp. TaxID=158754 RepID=UPI0035CC2106
MTVTIFYTPGSCALGCMAALGYAGIHYETELVELRGERTELRRYNPAGRVPTLVRGDFVLTETPAIIRWIAEEAPHAALLATDREERARGDAIMNWMSSHLHILRRRQFLPILFAQGEAAQAEVRAMARPLYEAEVARLDALIGSGALAAPGLQAYALVFLNWALIDEVPADKLTNLRRVLGAFAKYPGVGQALEFNDSAIAAESRERTLGQGIEICRSPSLIG